MMGFEEACKVSKALQIPQAVQLELYGLYKQATQGNCSDEIPSDPLSKAKWQAWNIHKGKSQEQAANEYIATVNQVAGQGWGIGVSQPLVEEDQGPPFSHEEHQIATLCESAQKNLDLELLEQLGPNVQDRENLTPLHHAADSSCLENCQKLICAGANPNLQDSFGMTPLHYAASLGDLGTCKLLLGHPDIDLSIQDNEGLTAREIASEPCCRVFPN